MNEWSGDAFFVVVGESAEEAEVLSALGTVVLNVLATAQTEWQPAETPEQCDRHRHARQPRTRPRYRSRLRYDRRL